MILWDMMFISQREASIIQLAISLSEKLLTAYGPDAGRDAERDGYKT